MERFDLINLSEAIEAELGAEALQSEEIYAVLDYLWKRGVDLRPAWSNQ